MRRATPIGSSGESASAVAAATTAPAAPIHTALIVVVQTQLPLGHAQRGEGRGLGALERQLAPEGLPEQQRGGEGSEHGEPDEGQALDVGGLADVGHGADVEPHEHVALHVDLVGADDAGDGALELREVERARAQAQHHADAVVRHVRSHRRAERGGEPHDRVVGGEVVALEAGGQDVGGVADHADDP